MLLAYWFWGAKLGILPDIAVFPFEKHKASAISVPPFFMHL
jgi:hypothetical protein